MKATAGMRAAISVIAALLVQAHMIPAQAAPDIERIPPAHSETAGRTPTSKLARTDRALLARTDAVRVAVLVKLDHDSVASYRGGLPGLAATSPAATGRRLHGGAAERAYEHYLAQRERRFADELATRLPAAQVGQELRTVYGGLAVTLPAYQVKELLAVDGVVAVQRDELRQPLTDSSAEFIGADRLPSPTRAGPAGHAGKGVIVGILDTGAWPEHPSLADQGNLPAPPHRADGKPRACHFGGRFRCNHKLIAGNAYLSSYLAAHPEEKFHDARDSDGHGTHTASTAAGNMLDHAELFGVDQGPIRGVAPGAWVSVYKVCGAKGCFSSDSAAAVAAAVRDGVDVINFSISGGVDPFTDPVEMAFLDAYAAGVFVAASAGNSGPDAGTVNHLSPWVTTVAASTQRREFATELTLTAGGATKKLRGVSVTGGIGPAPVVRNGKCLKPAKPGAFTGKIVICKRGENARVAKGWNVKQGGAIGMILFNPQLQDVETDNHWLPAVHLPDAKLLSFLDGHQKVTASFTAGHKADGQPDVMAGFSSRGAAGLSLKPDVTAPGVQILAGHTPVPDELTAGPPGQLFQAIAGTSMSSPHVAGAAALLAAQHPAWTPGQIKSALMTTARTDVVKEDLVTPADPLDFGAGRIAVDRAAQTGLTVAESALRMLDFAADEVRSVDLNLPSVNAPVMPGLLRTKRTVRNVTNSVLSYRVRAGGPGVSVTPGHITVPPDGTATIEVKISSLDTDSGWRFGAVELVPSAQGVLPLRLPVAYRASQGAVTLTGSCSSPQVALGEPTSCRVKARNTGYTDASVQLSTSLAPGLAWAGGTAAHAADLAGVTPGVPALSRTPGRRWQPLPGTADPISDEAVINYQVPSFTYAGEQYDTLGVVSNGYLIVGGGTIQDVRYEPPDDVGADRPNNVLAPYWADLDGSADEGIRVATVKAGGQKWIVVEWRVHRYGTDERVHFQAWLAISPAAEAIRFAYDPDALPRGAEVFAVGAENALGQGVLVRRQPGPDQQVRTSGFRPGGTLGYAITVRGLFPADSAVTTAMSSPDVPGTTVVHTPLTVTGWNPQLVARGHTE